MLRRLLTVLALLAPLLVPFAAPAPAGASTFAPAGGRLMFAGQSTKVSWDDYTSFAAAPSGGSVYDEVKSGTWVNAGHRDYATFLAQQGKMIQVGVSWKDNPPASTAATRTPRRPGPGRSPRSSPPAVTPRSSTSSSRSSTSTRTRSSSCAWTTRCPASTTAPTPRAPRTRTRSPGSAR